MTVPHEGAPVTVLTGASGGIGLALTAGLLAAGHDVLAVVRTRESLALLPRAPAGRRLVPIAADLAADAGRDAVRDAVQREFGGLTALINNAGIGMGSIRRDYYKRPVRPDEIDGDTLQRFMAVNAQAPVALALALLPLFTRGWGRIVNVGTSLTAMLRPGFLPYAMSKAALESASAVLAHDLADSGISVCVINPGGPVDTPMARRDEADARAALLAPSVLVAPVVWAASHAGGAAGGQRLTATRWREGATAGALAPIGWPQLASDSSWKTNT